MSNQISEAVGIEPGRPADAWPDDVDGDWPPDPALSRDREQCWAECNSDLARHLASIPEPPDSLGPPQVTAREFAEDALAEGLESAAAILAGIDPGSGSATLLAMLDPARMTPASMVGVIAATEKLASWVQALQHRWLAAFTVPGVAASREGLLAYASAPGQPLHRMADAADRRAADSRGGSTGEWADGCGGADLPCSGPAVHGDAEIDLAIDEVAFKVAAAEVSAALHFSPVTAQRRVRQALDFTIDLPGTLRALSQGRIDRGRALTILDRTENLPVDLRHKVEAVVLPKATSRTPGQLRGIVDRAVISVDPAAAKKREIKARDERHVTVRPQRDGMSTFVAELPAEQAGVAFSVLDRVATTLHRNRDEGRRIGALRADVFSDIFDQLATQGSVDLRATLGGRAVVTHDPLRFSWISDADTIAARFDPDTSFVDPQNESTESTERTMRDTGPTDDSPTDVPWPSAEPLADVHPVHDIDDRHTPSDPAASAEEPNPADDEPADDLCSETTSPAPDGPIDLTDFSDHIAGSNDAELRCGPGTSDRPNWGGVSNSQDTGPASSVSSTSADVTDLAEIVSSSDILLPPRIYTSVPGSSAAESDCPLVRTDHRDDLSSDTVTSADVVPANSVPTATGSAGLDPERGRSTRGISAADRAARSRTEPFPREESPAPGSDPSRIPAFAGPSPENSAGPTPFVFATQQGRLTHLNVTIAATTLAGLDELPGELDGHGPISADLCRALAVSAASITAVAVDPSCGTALDLGRTTYRPRLSQRDHVTQRDRTCRFPGCRQPARRCQIDHSEEFCDGGATCPCNLSCLCKFHHDLKTTGLWDAQQHPDASILWTSPTGRTYRTHTPEWPIAAPGQQPRRGTSTVSDAESCDTGDARMRSATAPAATDEPPF